MIHTLMDRTKTKTEPGVLSAIHAIDLARCSKSRLEDTGNALAQLCCIKGAHVVADPCTRQGLHRVSPNWPIHKSDFPAPVQSHDGIRSILDQRVPVLQQFLQMLFSS